MPPTPPPPPPPHPRGTLPRSQRTRRSHRDAEEWAGLWQLSAVADGQWAAHGAGEPRALETKRIKEEQRCKNAREAMEMKERLESSGASEGAVSE